MRKITALSVILLLLLNPFVFAATVNFEYDRNGNLLKDLDHSYEYNSFNQLHKVYDQNNHLLEEYTYDHTGNRIKKIEYNEGNTQTTYYINNVVRVMNSSGTFDTVYVHDDTGLLLARQEPDGRLFYYHPDLTGSNSLITDAQGNTVEETSYEPFGEVTQGGNDRFLFSGKEQDKSNLYYFGARYYNPALGKFTQPDTIIPDLYNPQSLNRYSYALNNPYKYTDKDGKNPLLLGSLIGGLIGAAADMIYQILYNDASMFDGSMDWGEVGDSALIGMGAGLAGGSAWALGTYAGMTSGIIGGSSWGIATAMMSGRGAQLTYNALSGGPLTNNMLNINAMTRDAKIGAIIGIITSAFSPSVVGSRYSGIRPSQDSVNPFIVENKIIKIHLAKFGFTEKPEIMASSFEDVGNFVTDGHHSFVAYTKLGYPTSKMNINLAQFSKDEASLFPNIGKYKDWSEIKYKLREPR